MTTKNKSRAKSSDSAFFCACNFLGDGISRAFRVTKKSAKKFAAKLEPTFGCPRSQRIFFAFSLALLFAASVFIGLRGAQIQSYLSDQANFSFQFQNFDTIRSSLILQGHSHLITWPFFWIFAQFGNTPRVIDLLTILFVLLTSFGILALIYFVVAKKNLLVSSLAAVGLSSVLLLVPLVFFDSMIHPIGFAMSTTRHIEYPLFALIAWLAISAKKWRSWKIPIAAGLLALLSASDVQFAPLFVGAAIALLALYAWRRRSPHFSSIEFIPLAVGLAGYVGQYVIFFAIKASHLVILRDVANGSSITIADWPQVVWNAKYFVKGLFMNFGASGASGITSVIYLGNAVILLAAIFFSAKLCVRAFNKKHELDAREKFILFLLAAAAAQCFLGVVSREYGGFNIAHYTGLILLPGLFAIAYGLSLKKHEIWLAPLLVVGLVLCVFSFALSVKNNDALVRQVDNYSHRNTIASVTKAQRVTVAFGEFQSVYPTKLVNPDLTVLPVVMNECGLEYQSDGEVSLLWQKAQNSRSAIIRDARLPISDECLASQFGRPERIENLGPGSALYIYGYDIRAKMRPLSF